MTVSVEVGGLPGDFLAVIVGRKRERERLRLARLHPGHGRLELGQHPALAQHDREVLRLASRELDAVDAAREVDDCAVARLRRARDGLVARALLAEDVDRVVHVFRSDFGHRAFDRDGRQVAQPDVGIDLEHRRKLELVGGGRVGLRLDARIPGHTDVLLPHRVGKPGLNGIGDHLGAHLRAVLLRDHLHRHLAGPEPRHLHVAREPREAFRHLALDVGDGNGQAQPPLELTDRLQLGFHARRILADNVVRKGGAKGGTRTPTGCPAGS